MAPAQLLHSISDTIVPRDVSHLLPDVAGFTAEIAPRSAPPPQLANDTAVSALAPLQPLQHLNTLARRQQTTTTVLIPLTYKNLDSGPAPGAVAGIVVGAVAGFLVSFYLIYFLTVGRRSGVIEGDETDIYEVHHHRSRSPPRRRKRRRTRERSEHTEHRSRTRTPPRASPRPRRERIIVEERRRTESRPPPMPPPPMSEHISHREEEFEEERRVEGDDVVEVIEEHTSVSEQTPEPQPDRRKKKGFRTVDPNAYGGGNYEQREINERRRSSRR